jgi:hypothetical protein
VLCCVVLCCVEQQLHTRIELRVVGEIDKQLRCTRVGPARCK